VLSYRRGPASNLVSFAPGFDQSLIDRPPQSRDIGADGNQIETQPQPPVESVTWDLDEARLAQANDSDRTAIRQLYSAGSSRSSTFRDRLSGARPTVGRVAADRDGIDSDNDALESRRLGMSANGSTFGNIWLRAKSKVTISGTSQRFDGDWYVTSVTHKIDSGGFKSDFKAVR
jgi:Bacteriophage probable baseplate hub protein